MSGIRLSFPGIKNGFRSVRWQTYTLSWWQKTTGEWEKISKPYLVIENEPWYNFLLPKRFKKQKEVRYFQIERETMGLNIEGGIVNTLVQATTLEATD